MELTEDQKELIESFKRIKREVSILIQNTNKSASKVLGHGQRLYIIYTNWKNGKHDMNVFTLIELLKVLGYELTISRKGETFEDQFNENDPKKVLDIMSKLNCSKSDAIQIINTIGPILNN